MGVLRKQLSLVVVASAAGVLFFALRRVSERQVPAASPDTPAGKEPRTVEPGSSQIRAVEVDRAVAPDLVASEVEAAERTSVHGPGAEGNPILEKAESWRAVQRLLKDQDLLDACSRPTETETSVLNALVERASKVIDEEVSVEVGGRVAAGLYQKLPGYTPGEEFKLSKRDVSLYGGCMFTDSGEALYVDLSRAEYPQLYELSDRMRQLEAELEARKRAR